MSLFFSVVAVSVVPVVPAVLFVAVVFPVLVVPAVLVVLFVPACCPAPFVKNYVFLAVMAVRFSMVIFSFL